MSMCEDYPCCGHTDGLGCDWVSPNEVVPCNVCIEARASYPYHNAVSGCPTLQANAKREASLNIPADFECDDCGDADSKHPEFDSLCYTCGAETLSDWAREDYYSGANENN
jgi:hypothetical protein